MLKCIQRELESRQEVIDFMYSELSGGSPLFATLAKEITLSYGELTSVLPGAGELQQIYDFYDPIVLPQPEAGVMRGGLRIQLMDSCTGVLIDDIADALMLDDQLCCLGELPSSRPGDTGLETFIGLRQFGSDLYFEITATEGKAALTSHIRFAATPWRLILATIRNWKDIGNPESWLSLGRHVLALYIGAYDGEGFVRWKRTREEVWVK